MSLVSQAVRFAAVGVAATLTHVAAGLFLAEELGLAAWWANLAGFAGAVLVSYAGNLLWTFRLGGGWLARLPRFAAVAGIGLVLNQAIVFVAVDLLGEPYRLALAVAVLIVPAVAFVMSRQWVFAARV